MDSVENRRRLLRKVNDIRVGNLERFAGIIHDITIDFTEHGRVTENELVSNLHDQYKGSEKFVDLIQKQLESNINPQKPNLKVHLDNFKTTSFATLTTEEQLKLHRVMRASLIFEYNVSSEIANLSKTEKSQLENLIQSRGKEGFCEMLHSIKSEPREAPSAAAVTNPGRFSGDHSLFRTIARVGDGDGRS